MDDFSEKTGVALVTGGSGGIGREICRMMAERGSDVALSYRNNETAAAETVAAVEAHGRRADATALTLDDPDAVAAWVDGAVERFGGVHSLIVAAGPHVPMIHLSRVSPAQFRRQVTDDLLGFFNTVHPALPHLRETSGSLTVVTTAATRRYPVRDGLSVGPKGGIEALVRGFAAEEGRFGIRANCVGPGMLTDGNAERLISSGELDEHALEVTRGNIALRRFGSAGDIAEAVCFLVSDRAGFISGVMLDVDGGYSV